MPDTTHISLIPPAGQVPRAASCKGTPDLRRHAHSASLRDASPGAASTGKGHWINLL